MTQNKCSSKKKCKVLLLNTDNLNILICFKDHRTRKKLTMSLQESLNLSNHESNSPPKKSPKLEHRKMRNFMSLQESLNLCNLSLDLSNRQPNPPPTKESKLEQRTLKNFSSMSLQESLNLSKRESNPHPMKCQILEHRTMRKFMSVTESLNLSNRESNPPPMKSPKLEHRTIRNFMSVQESLNLSNREPNPPPMKSPKLEHRTMRNFMSLQKSLNLSNSEPNLHLMKESKLDHRIMKNFMSLQKSVNLSGREPNPPLIKKSKLYPRIKRTYVFLSLPDEILLKILGYMDIFNLKGCAQVSRRLQRVALDPTLVYSDNRSVPSLYERTLCLCVKNLISKGLYEIAKNVEVKHCNEQHCRTVRHIWDQIITSENTFEYFTSATPIQPSKEWHASVKINEREHLVHRL